MKRFAVAVTAVVTLLAVAPPAGAAPSASTVTVACANSTPSQRPATVTFSFSKPGLTMVAVDNSCVYDWIQVTVFGAGSKVSGVVSFDSGRYSWDARMLAQHHIRGFRADAQVAPPEFESGQPACGPAPNPDYEVTANRVFDCNQTTPKMSQIVKQTDVFQCANGKHATFHHEGWESEPHLWTTTSETIDNPCTSQWLVITTKGLAPSETSCCVTTNFAPGAHFHAARAKGIWSHAEGGLSASLQSSFSCDGGMSGNNEVVDAQGRTSPAPPCPSN